MRFLLLTDPRSGTMMLTDTLAAAHPEIRWYNLYAANPDNPLQHHLNWEDHLRDFRKDTFHVGTTMHRVGDNWLKTMSPIVPSCFWEWLRRRHDRWILLRRENILRQYLSKQVGVVLRSYAVDKPRHLEPGPVRIVVQEFLEYLDTVLELREKIDAHFPGYLALRYIQLADQWESTFRVVQEYLELPTIEIKPVTFRQETRPLSESILNYDEVRSYLTNRGYGRWFDE